jgi:enoyl-CoA hydratase/carnithine racemase
MDAVRLEERPDRVAVLTLDQPNSRANILSAGLWAELEAALTPLRDRTDLAGLVVASAKPGIFVAGADLKFFLNLPGPNDPTCKELVEQGLRVLALLEGLPFPTCAAIDGAALGGGLEVALACDYRVIGTHAKVELGLPETKLGLVPGWGGTQRLPRVIGLEQAVDLLRTGGSLNGPAAVAAGLALAQVPSAELVEHAARLVADPPEPVTDVRRRKAEPMPPADRRGSRADEADTDAVLEAVNAAVRGAALSLADGLAVESAAFLRVAGSDEAKRRIGEFFASRKR